MGGILPDPSKRPLKYQNTWPGKGVLSHGISFYVRDQLGPSGFISATDAALVNLQIDNTS